MPSINDEVLGEILVRRSRLAKSIRISYLPSGKYSATVPTLTPLFYLKKVVRESRADLSKMAESQSEPVYTEGQSVGKRHTIRFVRSGLSKAPAVKTLRDTIVVTIPPALQINDTKVQRMLRTEIAKVLRKEAKLYLPERLASLARTNGFHYERVRFSHASSRWGSCSSTGTISLNIALMKLPDTLIDYVLIHELSHTRQMNHSPAFWKIVSQYDPLFKLHRRQIKQQTPHI